MRPIACVTIASGLLALSACANNSPPHSAEVVTEEINETTTIEVKPEVPAPRTPEAFYELLARLRADPELMGDLNRLKTHRSSAKGIAARNKLDKLAAQRDAWVSGLYWHTDIGKAKVVARERGLPIVSLRLLGRLDEEFC